MYSIYIYIYIEREREREREREKESSVVHLFSLDDVTLQHYVLNITYIQAAFFLFFSFFLFSLAHCSVLD